jgi:hypothetical protein
MIEPGDNTTMRVTLPSAAGIMMPDAASAQARTATYVYQVATLAAALLLLITAAI